MVALKSPFVASVHVVPKFLQIISRARKTHLLNEYLAKDHPLPDVVQHVTEALEVYTPCCLLSAVVF